MDGVETLASSYQRDQTVTVVLDSDDTFILSKALLCDASKDFAEALRVKREDDTSTLELHDCDTDTFKLFLYWLCKKTLPDFKSDIKQDKDNVKAKLRQIHGLLARLGKFGSMHSIATLQEATRQCMRNLMLAFVTPLEVVRDSYAILPESAAEIRRLLMDAAMHQLCRTPKGDAVPEDLAKFSEVPSFIVDFMIRAKEYLQRYDGAPKRTSSGDVKHPNLEEWMKANYW